MQNAILGMKYLNITQGNLSGYTHKGIYALDLAGIDGGKDVWRAKNRWKCTNIKPYDTTGFANTCFFSPCDENGNLVEINTPLGVKKLTIALTHDNSIRVKKGVIYSENDFIYMEGTKGNATGNHIHAEATFDFVTEKIKKTGSQYYKGSTWVLPNAVSLHNALFLLKDYNISINNRGYLWSIVNSIEFEEETMGEIVLVSGKQTVSYKGHKYMVVKQAENEDVKIWSLTHPSLAKLSLFNSNGEKPNFAKNLSFFITKGANRGQVLGSEISDIYDEAVPTSHGYIDVVKLKDGTWKHGNFGPYIYRGDEVELRYSTGMVLVAGGVYSNEYSVGAGEDIRTKKTIMSCTFVDWSNVAYMVNSLDSVTPDEMREFAMALEMQYAFRDDSGGSTEITQKGTVISGGDDGGSERHIPNALVFLPKEEKPVDPYPEEPEEPETITVEEHERLLREAVEKVTIEKDAKILELENNNISLGKKISQIREIVS